jgi:hypothetical protein
MKYTLYGGTAPPVDQVIPHRDEAVLHSGRCRTLLAQFVDLKGAGPRGRQGTNSARPRRRTTQRSQNPEIAGPILRRTRGQERSSCALELLGPAPLGPASFGLCAVRALRRFGPCRHLGPALSCPRRSCPAPSPPTPRQRQIPLSHPRNNERRRIAPPPLAHYSDDVTPHGDQARCWHQAPVSLAPFHHPARFHCAYA